MKKYEVNSFSGTSEDVQLMSDKLKPCPFCGKSAIEIKGNKKRYISCYICGARTKNVNTTKEAIKRWNERASCDEHE